MRFLLAVVHLYSARASLLARMRPKSSEDIAFAAALEEAGYFATGRRGLRGAVERHGFCGAIDDPALYVHWDWEDVAEGGVGEFVDSLRPGLARFGVRLPGIEQADGDEFYAVRWAGRPWVVMWDGAVEDYGWDVVTERAFAFVNRALDEAETSVRLFAISAGNDGCAWLLTPAQAEVVKTHCRHVRASELPRWEERPYQHRNVLPPGAEVRGD